MVKQLVSIVFCLSLNAGHPIKTTHATRRNTSKHAQSLFMLVRIKSLSEKIASLQETLVRAHDLGTQQDVVSVAEETRSFIHHHKEIMDTLTTKLSSYRNVEIQDAVQSFKSKLAYTKQLLASTETFPGFDRK